MQEKAPDPAQIRDPRIIYVGEGGRLGRRWRQFEKSALGQRRGHSGGQSYGRRFGGRQWARLHVAALPIWFGEAHESMEPLTTRYRLAVEQLILWEITLTGRGSDVLLNAK